MRGGCSILMIAFLAVGCERPAAPSSSSGPVDVKGKAEDADGKPLGDMILRFRPVEEANKGQWLTCPTQADGSFVGKCLPGRYKVTLHARAKALPDDKVADKLKGPPPTPPLPDDIPKKYGSAADTPWEVVVPDGGKTNIVLKIQ